MIEVRQEFGPPIPGLPHSALRVEDRRLISGSARFVADLLPPDCLHAAFVRSPIAHGRILHLDITAALRAEGVVAVFTAEEIDAKPIPSVTGRGPVNPAMVRPVLAESRVRHVGEAMAVVVATSEAAAVEGVELVEVDWEPLEVVTDPLSAAEGPKLFEGSESNIVHREDLDALGSPEPGPDEIEVRVSVPSPRLVPNPIELLGILVEPGLDGSLMVTCGHQAPHRLARQLASLLGLPDGVVRVRVPDVGGAFGMKGSLYPEYVAVTAVGRTLGRPVAWVQRRREHFVTGIHGRSALAEVSLIGDRQGRIRRLRVDVVGDVGAYPHNGSRIPLNSAFLAPGPYRIPEVQTSTTIVVTNKAPTGSYRGAGRPEATLALERAVDAYARRAGLDPFQVRHLNLLTPSELPHRSSTGARYDSGDYPAALRAARKAMDSVGSRLSDPKPGHSRGKGVAFFMERAGGAADSGEYARVAVDDDGRVVVHTGSTASGQGHETTFAQVAAAALGTSVDMVTVISGDTSRVLHGIGSYGSRSTQVGGSAVWRMAKAVRTRIVQAVADQWEAAPADLEVGDGIVRLKGVPGMSMTLAKAAFLSRRNGSPPDCDETFVPGEQTFPYGVHGAVVDVDPETGQVELAALIVVDDCGNILNPMIVEGQVHGSVMQGVGQALFEVALYDEFANPLTTSLATYSLPTAITRLPMTIERLVSPAPSNPLGVKGTGEVGCIGMPAAIFNAVIDALIPLDVTHLDLPLTPHRVWQAIHEAGSSTDTTGLPV